MNTPVITTRSTSSLPLDTTHRSAPLTQHDKLVKNTQKLVAQTFYGKMLKQMRDDPFKSKIFDGGRGGEAFSSLLDQNLSERMARGAGGKLVKSIVDRIEHAQARKTSNAGASPAANPAALSHPGAASAANPLNSVTRAAGTDAYRAQSRLHASQSMKIAAIGK